MRVFGCTWKINFPEIIFSWLGVLKALTRKWFEVKIFTSNHFWTHAQRERESLRLRRSTNPLVYELITPSTSSTLPITSSTSPIYEPTNQSLTQSLRPTSLRLRWRPRAFVPRTNLSLSGILIFCVILIDPRAFDLWFFLLLLWWCGWWCFGGFPVVWVVVENSIFRMLPNT